MKTNENINQYIKTTQKVLVMHPNSYHQPFHVLTYSFLPMLVAAFVGSFAILFVTKLHLITTFCQYDFIPSFLSRNILKTTLTSNEYIHTNVDNQASSQAQQQTCEL